MSSHSLRKDVINTIKSQHPELTSDQHSWFRKMILWFSQKDSWWKVMLLVVGILIIGVSFPLKFLQVIRFETVTPSVLIDQRATNLAAIISMTIAVIGFLLSNLSIKEPQTYKLLFERSKLYFIIYYSLSVIGSLMVISTLRDSLPKVLFAKLVLTGTYMALSILLCIGYLFKTIINFASAAIMHLELVNRAKIEAKNKIYIQLISTYGTKKLDDWMAASNLIESTPAIEQLLGQPTLAGAERTAVLYDINLKKLGKQIAMDEAGAQQYYRSAYTLNALIPEPHLFIYSKNKAAATSKDKLAHCLMIRAKSRQLEEKGDYLNYFTRKLEEYAEAGNTKKLGETLSLLNEIYDLEMKNQPF